MSNTFEPGETLRSIANLNWRITDDKTGVIR